MFNPEWLLRLLCAILIGGVIGQERASKSKEAGFRTHVIVAMASCALMIVSKYGFDDVEKVDAARIAAGVISGIGFLGGGIIFVQKGSVRGMTTAAGIWATAALGLCVGAGMYWLGLISAGVILFLQSYSHLFHRRKARNLMSVLIHVTKDATLYEINDCLEKMHFEHFENQVIKGNDEGWYIETDLATHRDVSPSAVLEELMKNEKVLDVKVLNTH